MSEVAFTSGLSGEHRDDVEQLLFFNPNQAKVVTGIEVVMRRYGVPRLRSEGDRVSIAVGTHATQTLYAVACDGNELRAIGLAVYLREGDTLVVLFCAVAVDYGSGGAHAGVGLLRRLMAELQAIARRVRGVNQVAVYFGRATPTRIPVRRPAAP